MELIVASFPKKYRADEVMLELLKAEEELLINLEDAVVVTENTGGKVRVKPYFDLIAESRGKKSEFLGTFIQNLFKADTQTALAKIGLDRAFCDQVKMSIPANSSAIFILNHNKFGRW